MQRSLVCMGSVCQASGERVCSDMKRNIQGIVGMEENMKSLMEMDLGTAFSTMLERGCLQSIWGEPLFFCKCTRAPGASKPHSEL